MRASSVELRFGPDVPMRRLPAVFYAAGDIRSCILRRAYVSDAYFDRRVQEYFRAVKDAASDDEQLRRLLRMFAKEIERDTRHRAADLVTQCQNDIFNLKHS